MSDHAWVWLEAAAPMSEAVKASEPPVACDDLWAAGLNVDGFPVIVVHVTAAVAAVEKSEIVLAACVPVCVERSRSCASVALAVAPLAIPSSFVFAAEAAHHAATAWNTRCAVQARRVVAVPASASACETVSADHSRESDSRESPEPTASVIPYPDSVVGFPLTMSAHACV